MKDIIKECFYTKIENEKEFEYSFNLIFDNFSLKRKIDFSNFVLSIVLADDMYNPLLKDIAINIGLVEYFTDVNINDVVLNENSKLTLDGIFNFEKFQESCNLVEIIKFSIDDTEYTSLVNSIEQQIEFKTGIRNMDNDLNYSVCNLLNTLEEKIDTLNFEDVFDIGNKLANISDDLTVDKLVEAYGKTL